MFRTIAWAVVAGLLIGWQWPEFRGANGAGKARPQDCRSPGARRRTPLEDGRSRAWSSPVVIDRQIWVTTATARTHLYRVES
jgi:hypothetical protein